MVAFHIRDKRSPARYTHCVDTAVLDYHNWKPIYMLILDKPKRALDPCA